VNIDTSQKSHDLTVFYNVFVGWRYNLMKIRSLYWYIVLKEI